MAALGDVFWSLQPALVYVAGTEIPVTIYVANPTDEDREYALSARIQREGRTVIEYPIRIDDLVWFPVEKQNAIRLPGSLRLGYTDSALVLELYERQSNQVVDSVSAALTSAGTQALPGLPGLPPVPTPTEPSTDMFSSIFTVMMVMVMMTMMTRVMK
jgi:hypothetical protein